MNNRDKNKISALLILHNEEKLVKRCLESLKGAVDEIFVIHDGSCSDNTLKICKKQANKINIPIKINIRPFKGRASLHMIFAFQKIKYDWILKIDADEFLSEELRKNLKKLTKNKNASAYKLRWPWWNTKKYITRNFPHKKALFRKSKVSFIDFPGNDEPDTTGKTIISNLHLEHKPLYNNFSWKNLIKRGAKRAKHQAEYTLKNFKDLERFQYKRKDFKKAIKALENLKFKIQKHG